MAYYLQRIRLAEICRHVADMVWDTDADQVAVEDVNAVDREFDTVVVSVAEGNPYRGTAC